MVSERSDRGGLGDSSPNDRVPQGAAAFRGLSGTNGVSTTKGARSNFFDRAPEKRQRPTLPPGGAVPSALVSLTSLFGMARGGSSPL